MYICMYIYILYVCIYIYIWRLNMRCNVVETMPQTIFAIQPNASSNASSNASTNEKNPPGIFFISSRGGGLDIAAIAYWVNWYRANMWLKHVKTMPSEPSPKSSQFLLWCYVYHSHFWVVWMILFWPHRNGNRHPNWRSPEIFGGSSTTNQVQGYLEKI